MFISPFNIRFIMCGIIGYVGSQNAKIQILDGLRKIEYRGYDSAGVAVQHPDGRIELSKAKGGIAELEPTTDEMSDRSIGVGHTRWATHGEPNATNAHPHQVGGFTIVHNGIIENYEQIRQRLGESAKNLASETDTEVLAALMERNFQKTNDALSAISSSLKSVRGTFGLAILHESTPNVLYLARRSSPLVVAETSNSFIAASDITALPTDTKHVTYLDDDQIAIVESKTLRVTDLDHNHVDHNSEVIDVEAMEADKQGQDHFMLKEILEQPHSVAETLRGRLDRRRHTSVLGGLGLTKGQAKRFDQIIAVACGTATHSAILASYLLEDIIDLPVHTEPASEFLYRKQHFKKGRTLGLAISQSGETADTIAAVNKLNLLEVHTHGIVNAIGSNISRITDGGTYLRSGPEIAVASTKAFTSMAVAQLLVGLKLNELRGRPIRNNKPTIASLRQLPEALQATIDATHQTSEDIAKRLNRFEKVMFLGRDSLYPIALEGALKYKEITYIPAEAHPAGEMKHGPLALVDEDMLVVYLAREGELFDKSISNLKEIEARHGQVLVITDSESLASRHENAVLVPKSPSTIAPLLFNIPLQFLAYYTALARKLNIDKPRNLAKSVTVE